MTARDVVIAGGGPTGLMLAGELALAGVDVVVVERRASQALDGSRAGGLHARSLEVLDQRGIAERFLAEGRAMQTHTFAGVSLDISDFPTRHPYGLALWQSRIEHLLAAWVGALAVPIMRDREVAGFTEDDSGVDVALADGTSLRAAYLVGCDGGRSRVRNVAGIDFAGVDPSCSWLIAEVEMDEPQLGVRREGGGIGPVDREKGGGPYRVVLLEKAAPSNRKPTLRLLSEALVVAYGTDFGVRRPTWISRFTDAARQAISYRKGRVLLAGDAAHVHSPHGGQGLNAGLQDAVNLGWKLAQVVKRRSPENLLDTYHAERHPVGARVLRTAIALAELSRADPRRQAVRDIVVDMLDVDALRRRIGAMLSGLDIRYGLGDGHPLLGRRMPDLDLLTAAGTTRMYHLLHGAQAVLVDFGGCGRLDTAGWDDRVRRIDATYEGAWVLPALGEVRAPRAVLVRPDGHVAWVADGSDAGLADAMRRWCGTPVEPT